MLPVVPEVGNSRPCSKVSSAQCYKRELFVDESVILGPSYNLCVQVGLRV